MKTVLILVTGSILGALLFGCAKEERFGEHLQPTYFPVIKETPPPDLPKEVTTKFVGTVMAIRPATPKEQGIYVGSKFHCKYAIDIRVDRIIKDDRNLVTLDQKSTFLVENLRRVFVSGKPKLDGPEKERQYRFTVKGELGNESKYEYLYIFGLAL